MFEIRATRAAAGSPGSGSSASSSQEEKLSPGLAPRAPHWKLWWISPSQLQATPHGELPQSFLAVHKTEMFRKHKSSSPWQAPRLGPTAGAPGHQTLT